MLYDSLQTRVLSLDDNVLGGAHFSDAAEPAADGTYTAPIGELRERMDALSADEDEFVDRPRRHAPARPTTRDIIATNLGQNAVDDDEAFTLELGPNNCAASQDALTSDD